MYTNNVSKYCPLVESLLNYCKEGYSLEMLRNFLISGANEVESLSPDEEIWGETRGIIPPGGVEINTSRFHLLMNPVICKPGYIWVILDKPLGDFLYIRIGKFSCIFSQEDITFFHLWRSPKRGELSWDLPTAWWAVGDLEREGHKLIEIECLPEINAQRWVFDGEVCEFFIRRFKESLDLRNPKETPVEFRYTVVNHRIQTIIGARFEDEPLPF